MRVLEDIRLQEIVIIFTTNKNPEYFDDEALIRPGRIDYCEEFGYCNTQQFKNVFADYVGSEIPSNFVFKEQKYSMAHIVNQVIVPYHDNPSKIFELLTC